LKIALFTAKPNSDNVMYGHKMSTDEKRPPHGIGYLYKILKDAGLDVDIFDRYCGDDRWPTGDFKGYTHAGIYCTTVCTNDIEFLINRLQANSIIVGGPHATLFPEWFSSKVRYIVQGEGEKIILPLVYNYMPKQCYEDNLIKTDRLVNEELDLLPRFPYEYFWERKERYTWTFPFSNIEPVYTISSSRGCPFSCSFCSVKKIWGRKITYMSAERVYDDICYVQSLGAKGIYFREDNFTVNQKRLYQLCKFLLHNNIKIKWACETRVDSIDEPIITLMANAGCIGLYIGVESLSQHMLDVFNKGVTVKQTIDCFNLANKYGIKTAASMIKGHPEETPEDRDKTRRRLNRIKPTMVWFNQYRDFG